MAKKKQQGSGVQSAQIEQLPIESLIPYARNSRTHSESQVAQIAGSIQEFGFCNPVLIDAEGVIIAGHGRVMAAQRLRLATVPCLRLSHLTDAQKRAYVIADNRIALNSGWDEELLANELSDLRADDFDLALLGFDADELAKALSFELGDESTGDGGGEIIEDEVPETPADPITKPGDLWILGSHRLLCGDSTKAADVARLMAGVKADLCFTSPPYGQQRDYTKESDCSDWDKLMRGVFENLPMADAGQVLVNLGLIHRDGEWIPYWEQWIEWMRSQGWKRFGWYVWDKGESCGANGAGGRLPMAHEWIFHFCKTPKAPDKTEPTKHAGETYKGSDRQKDGTLKEYEFTVGTHKCQESVFRSSAEKSRGDAAEIHPARFSVAFASRGLKPWPGIAYEPFCGSGTTLIAAEQLNRRCFGMEISPAYCDVIVKRWENLTGKTAVLEAA